MEFDKPEYQAAKLKVSEKKFTLVSLSRILHVKLELKFYQIYQK